VSPGSTHQGPPWKDVQEGGVGKGGEKVCGKNRGVGGPYQAYVQNKGAGKKARVAFGVEEITGQ